MSDPAKLTSVARDPRRQVWSARGWMTSTHCPACGKVTGWSLAADNPGIWTVCEGCSSLARPIACRVCHAVAPAFTRLPRPDAIYVCDPCYEEAGVPPGMSLTPPRSADETGGT